MSKRVTIKIMNDKATTDGQVWTSENKQLETLLNTLCGPDSLTEYEPDLPQALADQAIVRFGAFIVSIEYHSGTEIEKPSVIY